jgi:hypothetical protein
MYPLNLVDFELNAKHAFNAHDDTNMRETIPTDDVRLNCRHSQVDSLVIQLRSKDIRQCVQKVLFFKHTFSEAYRMMTANGGLSRPYRPRTERLL